MNVPGIIIVASHLPILLAVVIAAMQYRQLGKARKTFCWFIFLSGVIQFTSLVFWYLGKNNMPLLHLYVAAGFICLAWFYNTVLDGFVNAGIIWSGALLFLLFTMINSLFIQDIFIFNANALVVQSVLVVILALFTFLFFLNDLVKEAGGREIKGLNWINSGLFIYHSSSLLIFYFDAAILRAFAGTLNLYPWVLHSFFSMVMYTCFVIGLWKRSET